VDKCITAVISAIQGWKLESL